MRGLPLWCDRVGAGDQGLAIFVEPIDDKGEHLGQAEQEIANLC